MNILIKKKYYFKGGLGTPQEMCYDYLFYYPRKPLMGACVSYPTDNEWNKFFEDLAKNGEIEFIFDKVTNQTDILQSLQTLNSDSVTVNKIRNFFSSANQSQICLLDDFTMKDFRYANPKPIAIKDPCTPIVVNHGIRLYFSYISIMTILLVIHL